MRYDAIGCDAMRHHTMRCDTTGTTHPRVLVSTSAVVGTVPSQHELPMQCRYEFHCHTPVSIPITNADLTPLPMTMKMHTPTPSHGQHHLMAGRSRPIEARAEDDSIPTRSVRSSSYRRGRDRRQARSASGRSDGSWREPMDDSDAKSIPHQGLRRRRNARCARCLLNLMLMCNLCNGPLWNIPLLGFCCITLRYTVRSSPPSQSKLRHPSAIRRDSRPSLLFLLRLDQIPQMHRHDHLVERAHRELRAVFSPRHRAQLGAATPRVGSVVLELVFLELLSGLRDVSEGSANDTGQVG